MESTRTGTEQEPGSALARETRPWGYWYDLERTPSYRVKVLVVEAGKRLSLQVHAERSETWTVLEGTGHALVAGREYLLHVPDVIDVPQGAPHRLSNRGARPLVVLEVQRGKCDEDDITRLEDDFGRAHATGGEIKNQPPYFPGGCVG